MGELTHLYLIACHTVAVKSSLDRALCLVLGGDTVDLYYIYLFSVWSGGGVGVGGVHVEIRSQLEKTRFFALPMWVPGIKLGSLSLVASLFYPSSHLTIHQNLAVLKIFLCVCVTVRVCVWGVCTCKCRCLWRPEEGVRHTVSHRSALNLLTISPVLSIVFTGKSPKIPAEEPTFSEADSEAADGGRSSATPWSNSIGSTLFPSFAPLVLS